MTHNTRERLRGEFVSWFREYPGTPTIGEIEDYWLDKMDEERKRLAEEIRNLIIDYSAADSWRQGRNDGLEIAASLVENTTHHD